MQHDKQSLESVFSMNSKSFYRPKDVRRYDKGKPGCLVCLNFGDQDEDNGPRRQEILQPNTEHRNVELCLEGPQEVMGKLVGDELVLVDTLTGWVFSSSERGPQDEFVRIGTWQASSQSILPLPKKTETQLQESTCSEAEALVPPPPKRILHPFQAHGEDHCETSPQAHADIAPILREIALQLGKEPSDLVVYDPYYCAGGTARNLAAAGFPRVINRNQDFYAVLESGEIPEHDVVVTNPPYSEDHVERALRFCASNLADHGRPWLMLLPNYCYAKNYFYPALKTGSLNAQKPFYLAPRKRYYYWTPKALANDSAKARLGGEALERKKKRTHSGPLGERTSPFLSFWYCALGAIQKTVLNKCIRGSGSLEGSGCSVVMSTDKLPSVLQV
eukprot:CAMPEP_0114314384 /NCGR_PEP_ID=MMETSP0059-20121206/21750_1 /TAXON_ID=36894 /ORGANISM="Pyramimonas parkeae, Strain CCMP726" /LENGTH=388 /DNA_ID=CAMNT_0001439463 /DNA_START=467 /DNA_END=1634 /DNA_ORIENTATION=+